MKEPQNEKVYFNLGMLAMDDREFDKAEKWFKRAIEVLKTKQFYIFKTS